MTDTAMEWLFSLSMV